MTRATKPKTAPARKRKPSAPATVYVVTRGGPVLYATWSFAGAHRFRRQQVQAVVVLKYEAVQS